MTLVKDEFYAIFSVSPRKGQRGVSVKDKNGRHMYYNAPMNDVAVEGDVILVAERDTFWGGEASREYRSRKLTNPTWRTVFAEFKKSQPFTRDAHHGFLEGVRPLVTYEGGKATPQYEGKTPLYLFSTGS